MAIICRLWEILPDGEEQFIREGEITTDDIRNSNSFMPMAEDEDFMIVFSIGGNGYNVRVDDDGILTAWWMDFSLDILDYQTKKFGSVEELCTWLDDLAAVPRYKVILVSPGGVKHDFIHDLTEEEAIAFCEEKGWEMPDENEFVWNLDYVLERRK